MAKRIILNKKVQLVNNLKEADEYLSEYAILSHELDAENDKLNKKIEELKRDLSEKQAPKVARMNEIHEGLQQFSINNKEAHFAKKRSIELTAGTLNFRIHPAKILQLKGFKVDKSIELLKDYGKGFRRFLVEKLSINKEQILAEFGELAKDEKLQADLLDDIEACGLQIVKDESFAISLDKSMKQKAA